MRTHIRLLAQPKSTRSIIDDTQREQRLGSAWNWGVSKNCTAKQNPSNETTLLTLKARGPKRCAQDPRSGVLRLNCSDQAQ